MRMERDGCKRPRSCPAAPRKRMKVPLPRPLSPAPLEVPPPPTPAACGGRSALLAVPAELVRVTLLYLDLDDLARLVVSCKSLTRCVGDFLQKLGRFEFSALRPLTRVLVLLTSAWPPEPTAAFLAALVRRWKADFLQARGDPFPACLGPIKFPDAAPLLAGLQLSSPRTLRTSRTRGQRLARARNQVEQWRSLTRSTAALQLALVRGDLEAVLAHVRALPPEPPSDCTPAIPQGPELLLRLRSDLPRLLAPWPLPAHGGLPVALDRCRVLLLKVCRKVLVRLRPASPDIVIAVRLFRQQLTECVRWYGTKPEAFDPEVARGLVKLIRKSRLYFVDQCGSPKCGKPEAAPQEHKRCSACAWVKYCSKECQRSDWTQHRTICQVLHYAVYPTS